ncbi:MAG: hypothetical protein U0353_18135 [Sandaracinus sp.]
MRDKSWVGSFVAVLVTLSGCGGSSPEPDAASSTPADAFVTPGTDAYRDPSLDAYVDPGSVRRFGDVVSGEYHLGPVEWSGSFWNACGPYDPAIETLEGSLLAGLSNELASDGGECDACIEITTDRGHTAIARVVTYGVTSAPGNLDLSSALYDMLTEGEYPRTMHWQRITCPTTEPLYVQYQTGANEWWTSLWIRNPRVPVDRVEVQSTNHASFTAMTRGADGTFTDGAGFGTGAFTLRVVGIDGSTYEEHFDGFTPGALVRASGNLP